MLRPRGSKKAAQFTESVIREMTRLAHRHNAVNLSQGFPDFPAPDDIKEAACAAIRGDINQYAVTWGARELREAIAAQFTRRYGVPVDADEQVTVCCGSTETMMATLLATVDAGRRGDRLRAVLRELRARRDRLGRGAALRDAARARLALRSGRAGGGVRAERTRAIIINSPNNPTGKVFSRAELTTIARALPAVGRAGDHRRDLRAHRLRRPRARADGRARRHGRSHGHDQRAVEDVQRDRLARRAGRSRRRR